MPRFTLTFCLSFVLFLTGCTTLQQNMPSVPFKKPYYKIDTPMQCVPYARGVSGIPIRGNAHTWWYQAEGKYLRGDKPLAGAVLVLSKTKRLRYGHLAVVKRVIDSRNITVTHTNWGGNKETRRVVYERMPARDVSPNNDWSQIRFWHYDSGTYGSVYKASGFIYGPK